MTDASNIEYAGIEHARLLQEVLQIVVTPKTVEEVARSLGCHKQTAHRYLWELRDAGRVKTLARKEGRHKLWQVADGSTSVGERLIATTHGTIKLGDIASSYSEFSGTPYINLVAGCLAYLYRREYYAAKDEEVVGNVAAMGSLDPYVQIRPVMEEIYRRTTTLHDILRTMLMDMPEIWIEKGDIVPMLGAVDLNTMEDAAAWFEAWAVNFK